MTSVPNQPQNALGQPVAKPPVLNDDHPVTLFLGKLDDVLGIVAGQVGSGQVAGVFANKMVCIRWVVSLLGSTDEYHVELAPGLVLNNPADQVAGFVMDKLSQQHRERSL